MKLPITILNCLLIFTVLILSPVTPYALDKVRMGFGSVSAIHGHVWIAQEKGLFNKYGIDPELIVIGGGGSVTALIAGDVQFGTGPGYSLISANLNGADLVMVAASLNKGVQRVMARPDLQTPAQLRGRKIGITRFGTPSHFVLQLMLRRWGMTPADVQTIQVGSSPAMVASLERGGIDAAVLTFPSVFIAEEKGYRVLADLADMDVSYMHEMIDTTRTYLRTNRDIVTRFIKAYLEGIAYFKQHKQESLEVLKKKLRADPRAEAHLERAYDLLAFKYFERAPHPSLDGVKTVLEFIAKENPKAKTADPKSFMDGAIMNELEASGFIRTLYEKSNK